MGAGPNGLAAAITLARAGRSTLVIEAEPTWGGGARTAELTLPGFRHDVCSAVHPLGVGSPFFAELPLAEHGLAWAHPAACLAHPFDDGSAAVLYRSAADTAQTLGDDGCSVSRAGRRGPPGPTTAALAWLALALNVRRRLRARRPSSR